MGLVKTNYVVPELGLNLPTAYAQITDVNVDLNGWANAIISVQQSRNDISTKKAIESHFVNVKVDKDEAIHKQIYNYVKENLFKDWTDDIVEE